MSSEPDYEPNRLQCSKCGEEFDEPDLEYYKMDDLELWLCDSCSEKFWDAKIEALEVKA